MPTSTVKASNLSKTNTLGKLVLLSLAFALCPVAAYALPTPLGSTLRLQADSTVESEVVTDSDIQSQIGTVNPLTASVSALATLGNASILSTANGTASWSDSAQGQVIFSNIGWDTIEVSNGLSNLFNGLDWTYQFVADATGLFTLDYNITGSGSDNFGLNGFSFFWSGLGVNDVNSFDLNSSGSITQAITAGNTYTITLQNQANIGGGLGTRNARMDGTFDWKMDTVRVATPEPSTIAMTGVCLAWLGLSRRKKISPSKI